MFSSQQREFKTANPDAIISDTKNLSSIFYAILKSKLNFEHFQKTTTLIVDAFAKLRTMEKPG